MDRDCQKGAEDVAVVQDEQAKRLQRGVEHLAGRAVVADQELEAVDQARRWVRQGEAAVHVERVWPAEGLIVLLVAAKLVRLAELLREALPAELRAPRGPQAELVSERQAALRLVPRKLELTELRARAAVQLPALLVRLVLRRVAL